MKRVYGLVGYACNGKSTIIKSITSKKKYHFIDLPQIYKDEASKRGFIGVTEWYTTVGLKVFSKQSKKAVLNYIDKELPRNENLIIDDIFDIDIYQKLISIFPQMRLIAFHSKYNDRLNRLKVRANIENEKDLILGLEVRDNMKKYCGIENIFPHCKYEITNKKDIATAKKMFNDEIKKNLIICIVGFSGCGKSTVSYYVGKEMNIPIYAYGKEVTKIINNEGYKKSREYIEEKGINSYISLVETKMYSNIKKYMQKNKFFLIDCIVSDDIYYKLKKNNEVYSIYIKLDKEKRVKRILKREKLDNKNAISELNTKDEIKIQNGLDIIVSKCNAIIDGNKELNNVISEVIKFIEKMNK